MGNLHSIYYSVKSVVNKKMLPVYYMYMGYTRIIYSPVRHFLVVVVAV